MEQDLGQEPPGTLLLQLAYLLSLGHFYFSCILCPIFILVANLDQLMPPPPYPDHMLFSDHLKNKYKDSIVVMKRVTMCLEMIW